MNHKYNAYTFRFHGSLFIDPTPLSPIGLHDDKLYVQVELHENTTKLNEYYFALCKELFDREIAYEYPAMFFTRGAYIPENQNEGEWDPILLPRTVAFWASYNYDLWADVLRVNGKLPYGDEFVGLRNRKSLEGQIPDDFFQKPMVFDGRLQATSREYER